ncbi:MAG TPA: sigma-70 family RNA polymerase sigma factor [Actinomycetota bacterium]|nr:sigma-70 family RNA polymerase sigma factor [Actinomycetota bacterium]
MKPRRDSGPGRPHGPGPEGDRPPAAPGGPDAPTDHDAALRIAIRVLSAKASKLTGRDREDLVQETLARAHAKGIPATEVPWLMLVMRRLAIDRFRNGREVAVGSSLEVDSNATISAPSPEEHVVRGDDAAAVRCAMDKMPPKYREVLLEFAQRQDAADIARRLGVSMNAAYLTVTRVRRSFADALARCGMTVHHRVQGRRRKSDRAA